MNRSFPPPKRAPSWTYAPRPRPNGAASKPKQAKLDGDEWPEEWPRHTISGEETQGEEEKRKHATTRYAADALISTEASTPLLGRPDKQGNNETTQKEKLYVINRLL